MGDLVPDKQKYWESSFIGNVRPKNQSFISKVLAQTQNAR
jgi:hypothetical protein